MQELQVFNYESKEIRTIEINGEPWWVAKDVCDILDLSDVSKAVSRLDEDEKGTNQITTLGGLQNMAIVNESGLYSLIIRSDKPESKKFKKWITSEVLPSIRKTGSYALTIAKNDLISSDIQSFNIKLNIMFKEIRSLKRMLSENTKPQTLNEIKSFFNVVDYSKKQQYIVVEYDGSLFSVTYINNFTIMIKNKTEDGVWENNWSFVKNQVGSLKKGLEYILEMY